MELKQLIQFLTNTFKFWVIIKEWQTAIHLRNGKIKRILNAGIYFKIPFLDSYYTQPNRVLEIHGTHINTLTQDRKNITISTSVFYKINNIKDFYLGYAEPNEIVSATTRNLLVKYIESKDADSIRSAHIETAIKIELKDYNKHGFEFTDFKIVTISNAKTYRLIKDNLYSQTANYLDSETH